MTWTIEMEAIESTEYWRVVDRWWTASPIERLFVALRAPDGEQIVVMYEPSTKQWTMQAEPRDGDRG